MKTQSGERLDVKSPVHLAAANGNFEMLKE